MSGSGFVYFKDDASNAKAIGISLITYRSLVCDLYKFNLAKKLKTGFRIINFKQAILQSFSFNIKILDKTLDFKDLVNHILMSVAYNKLNQQFFAAKKKLLDTYGGKSRSKASIFIKEGFADCMTSCRSMAKVLDCSALKANQILNFLTNDNYFKVKFVCKTSKFQIYKGIKTGKFDAERFLVDIANIRGVKVEPFLTYTSTKEIEKKELVEKVFDFPFNPLIM